VTRILLDSNLLGFEETPSYLHKMGVTVPEIQLAKAQVADATEAAETEASLVCHDRSDGATLLTRVQDFYKTAGKGIAISNTTASTATATAADSHGRTFEECDSPEGIIQAIIAEEREAPGCPQLQGEYGLGKVSLNEVEFTMTKTHIDGIDETKGAKHMGIAKDCNGWVIDGDTMKTFSYNNHAQAIVWDDSESAWMRPGSLIAEPMEGDSGPPAPEGIVIATACGTEQDARHPELEAAVQCCSMDGESCHATTGIGDCFGTHKTYAEALAICSRAGMRLCTPAQLENCCGAGVTCGTDDMPAWTTDTTTSTSSPA